MVAPRLSLGRIVATPGAIEAISEAGQSPSDFLARHSSGDWGEVDAGDREANNRALLDGSRLFSVYTTALGVKFYVITEADRSSTCLLLPSEY